MIANSIFAAGAFVSLVAAIPMAQAPYPKRDVVWETHTEVALTTIPVTVTHWLEPGETAPADATVGKQHYGHMGHGHGQGGHGKPPAEPEVTESAAPAAPAYSSPESAPEAPAPSSYEQPAPSSYVQPTTQQAPPPAPTTTQAPAPEPTTQQAPPPAYTPEPAPEQPSNDGGSSSGSNGLSGMAAAGKSYSGDITYWTPALGACGYTNTESEPVVAIAKDLFDIYTPASGNPNLNKLCGKYVSITGSDGSATRAKIVDRCRGCAQTDLDLSPTLFETVYPAGDGRVSGVKWAFA